MLWTPTGKILEEPFEQEDEPERACEPLLGSDDGKWIFESIFAALRNKTSAACA